MMGMPLPINMIFPKIQEEFKKIIESGDMQGLTFAIGEKGVFVTKGDDSILITPDLEYDEIIVLLKALWRDIKDGE